MTQLNMVRHLVVRHLQHSWCLPSVLSVYPAVILQGLALPCCNQRLVLATSEALLVTKEVYDRDTVKCMGVVKCLQAEGRLQWLWPALH